MLDDIAETVKYFLQKSLNAQGIRLVSLEQTGDGWVVQAEVAEKNLYFATINPAYRVFEKECYIIHLNAAREVTSYKRVSCTLPRNPTTSP